MGIGAMPFDGTRPVSSSAATTGTTLAAIGAAVSHHVWLPVIRRPAVRTTTANITGRKASSAARLFTAQLMTRKTRAGRAAALGPAMTIPRSPACAGIRARMEPGCDTGRHQPEDTEQHTQGEVDRYERCLGGS